MLCEVCQTLFEAPEGSGWRAPQGPDRGAGKHHETMAALANAAFVKACPICSSLQISSLLRTHGLVNADDVVGNNEQQQWLLTYEWDAYTQKSISPSKYPILRFRSPRYSKVDADCHEFALISSSSLSDDPLVIGLTSQSLETSDAMHLSFIWLQRCLKEHQECHASQESLNSPNPTFTRLQLRYDRTAKRLIKIGSSREDLRIIETSETPPLSPYATLSHCWGKHPDFFVLTTSNLPQMKQRIPSHSLPRTFQDAIKVARCLGIWYLWIDSLCILQSGPGSAEDWTEHTIAMRDIYARCLVNISADRAVSSEDGFLKPYSLDLISAACVQHPNGFVYRIVDLGLAHSCLAQSPLAKRAWVFQERWLSPRILHFTEQQVFWECAALPLACEAFPAGFPVVHDSHPYIGDSIQEYGRWSPTMAPFIKRNWLEARDHRGWYQVLEEYSSRALSYPDKDKFHALAGVVDRIHQDWQEGEYVAGFFRSDLPIALLWGVEPEKNSCNPESRSKREPSVYRGPSWSWTSMDKALTFSLATVCLAEQEHGKVTIAEIISAYAVLEDASNAFGPVRSASLIMRVHACAAHWKAENLSSSQEKESSEKLLKLIRSDGSTISTSFEYHAALDNPVTSLENTSGMMAILIAEIMMLETPSAVPGGSIDGSVYG